MANKAKDHISKLTAALKALLDAQAAGAGKSGTNDGSDSYDELSYPITQVKRHLVNKHVLHKMIGVDADGNVTADSIKLAHSAADLLSAEFVEIGAKLSADTRAQLNSVVDAIRALLPVDSAGEQTTDAEKVDVAESQRFVDELSASVSKLFAESEAKPTVTPQSPVLVESDPPISTLIAGGASLMHETATLLAEAKDSTPTAPKYRMLVIREGMSGNRVNYPGSVLRESAPLLANRPLYIDHPQGTGTAGGPVGARSIATKAGWWTNPQFEESIALPDGSTTRGITATLNLFSASASPAPWLPGMIQESLDRGNPGAVGISIFAAGKTKFGKDAVGAYKEALSITQYASADAVAEPGAGGQPLSLAASIGKDPEVTALEEMTAEKLKELNPALFESITSAAVAAANAEKDKSGTTGTTGTTGAGDKSDAQSTVMTEAANTQLTALLESAKAANTQYAEMLERQNRAIASMTLETRLRESRLPEKIKTTIRTDFAATTTVMAEAEISAFVARYEDIALASAHEADSPYRLREGMLIPYGGSALSESGTSPLDQVQLSLDDFFGAPIPEDKKGKYPKIRSFAEAYRQITGDVDVDGRYNPKLSALGDLWFREALPGAAHVVGGGTISMNNLLGTSMNKALFNFYQNQPRWWEPIVTYTDLQNLKQQDRIRLANFGSLTERTVDGQEYTELDWAETREIYTPTEFGNVVPVGRRAIINDDLKGIQSIPRLLAASAVVTINEYVSNFFTQNGGNGPVMADGSQVLNAANHQGNRISPLPLTRANAIQLRQAMMLMNNDAGKRIGIIPRTLLVPIQLEDTAWELVSTSQVPDSNNNAQNILANGERGLNRLIVVPNWTDPDNWYIMADPAQITTIEMGFLYGRREPELFSQSDPAVGAVFNNDVMTQKVRWDFGGSVIDYRGIAGGIN